MDVFAGPEDGEVLATMSQFFLVAACLAEPPPVAGIDLAALPPRSTFLLRAAEEQFGTLGGARTLFASASDTEALFLQAQRMILDQDTPIEMTPLGRVLDWIGASGVRAAIFYGSDWQILPIARSASELRRLVGEQLRDPRREVYVAFKPEA